MNLNLLRKSSEMDINTFGKSPAANYLARRLNELDNKKLSRACTVRVTASNANVSAIINSVSDGSMSAKVAANLLRLLREEATYISHLADELDTRETEFVGNLLRNTIIGHIKSAMRKTSIMRKIENGNVDIHKVNRKAHLEEPVDRGVKFFSILGYAAGAVYSDGEYYRQHPAFEDIEDPTTAELLHLRSRARCVRQNKEWTK